MYTGTPAVLLHMSSLQWRPVHNYKQNEAQHFQDAKVILKLFVKGNAHTDTRKVCLLYTSPSPRDLSTSRMPSSA